MSRPLDDLLQSRHSTRSFTSATVPRDAIEHMCRAARRAPSGANLQPGNFHVLTGDPLAALTTALLSAQENGAPVTSEYSYFPSPMPTPLKARQRAAGYALYNALGIERRDIEGRRAQFARNYTFFDAPVGIVVTINRDMGKGCFMDLGMALMAFLLAAEDQGYGATGIGALANYGPIVHEHLGLSADELVVCGIAVGKPDEDAPENQFRTDRAELNEYTSFHGFPKN
ncbi:nitroreductase [Aliiroseovarius sp. 2305UL8-7]|uniref:nitroreductase n=1 Tax=Aliiroseovarius conchicola TaxID=3121637 RepID=UPI003527A098